MRRVARGLWADHGDLEPSVSQRQALEPDATVERDGQILHDDQNPSPVTRWPVV